GLVNMGVSQLMDKDRRYDVIIIGGGPAGLTAALYAGRARVKTVLLERGAPGGQLLNTEAIEDYPGFDPITGPELAPRLADQAVAVIGGGEAALEEGVFLTRYAKKVYIIHRRDQFRAQAILVEAARKNPKIELLTNTIVTEIKGEDGQVTEITLEDVPTQKT